MFIVNIMLLISSTEFHVKTKIDDNIKQQGNGKKYLKGEYKIYCADDTGSTIASDCKVCALSNPSEQ